MSSKSFIIRALYTVVIILSNCIIIHGNPYFIPEPDHADTSCHFVNTAPANITDYVWNFGDGMIIHDTLGISPDHKYGSPGLYSVCLIVADSSEPIPFVDTTCQLVEIFDVNKDCYADFSYTLINDYKIRLTDNSTGDYKKVLWEFGDGKYSNIKNNVIHTYEAPGYYDVELAILDDDLNIQCHKTKSILIAPEDIIVDAYFTDSLNSFDKNRIYFINLSPHSMMYVWDFGDGAVSVKENPVHYYQTPGIYDVSLTVYDSISGNMDNYIKQTEVNISQLETKSNFNCYSDIENTTVYFQDLSLGNNIENHFWDFGDGDTAVEQNPVHQYAENGIYDVCLSTWGEDESDFNTFCRQVYLIDSTDTYADFYFYSDSSGNIIFKNVSRGDDLEYTWDFGDSTYLDEINPVHSYEDTGIYVIHLTAAGEYKNFHKFRILNFNSEQKSLIGGIGLIEEDEELKTAGAKKLKPKGIISGDVSKFAWKLNNTLINNTSLSPVTLNINQYYSVLCLELFNPYNTSCTICTDIFSGISGDSDAPFDKNNIFRIFPNPANDYISIEYWLENDEKADIKIVELTGRTIKHIPLNSNHYGRNIIKVSCDDLADGFYFIRLTTGSRSEVLKISVLR